MPKWTTIPESDIHLFLNDIKKLSFDKFLEVNEEQTDDFSEKIKEQNFELKTLLPEKESEIIASPFLKIKGDKYMFSEKTLYKIIERFSSRMTSNSINILASKEIIDIAYDSELNDFVFWIK